jgi:hypothetical protein
MRLLRSGGRILLVPDVVCQYIARDSMSKIVRMNYEYGYYKPLAAAKLGHIYSWRQVVPPAFVAALAALTLGSMVSPLARAALAALLAVYAAATVIAALSARGRLGASVRLYLALVFPASHLAYGTGYLAGIIALLRRRRLHRDSGPL